MATFRVGQRVRIVSSENFPQYVGKETRIASDLYEVEDKISGELYECFDVEIDDEFGPEPSQLEPIQPEGMQPVAWSECLWQPEHMRADA